MSNSYDLSNFLQILNKHYVNDAETTNDLYKRIESSMDVMAGSIHAMDAGVLWSELAFYALAGALAANVEPDQLCANLALFMQKHMLDKEEYKFKKITDFQDAINNFNQLISNEDPTLDTQS